MKTQNEVYQVQKWLELHSETFNPSGESIVEIGWAVPVLFYSGLSSLYCSTIYMLYWGTDNAQITL